MANKETPPSDSSPLRPELERYRIHSERVLAWLDKKWQGEKKCPVCSENDWLVGDTVTADIEGEPANYPLVPIICHNCGLTRLFNAILIGVKSREVESPVEPPSESPATEEAEK